MEFTRGRGSGWNFCNFLINVGGTVAIPKQGEEHHSEKFEQIKSKAIKVTIIGIILHYVIPFLKRGIQLWFHWCALFNIANFFINSILCFLKLKLPILCRVGTHGRKMYYESIFEWWKFNKRMGGGRVLKRTGKAEKNFKN